jgi:hypothetical protein
MKKENIPPQEDEFPVIKRKAEEVMAERPTKVIKKEDPLARKKVPITTTTRQPLKDKNVGLNAKVNQFSTSLRSSVSLCEILYIYVPLHKQILRLNHSF